MIPNILVMGNEALFALRGASGGIASAYVGYVTMEKNGKHFAAPLEIPAGPTTGTEVFYKLQKAILEVQNECSPNCREYNPNGGDMGREVR